MADFGGGGTAGFGQAYAMVAVLMLGMLCIALVLRKKADGALQAA